MEIRTLKYFLAIANEENFTRAAEYLHVSQPTLSRQMMDLEDEFGKQLFIRGKRKVQLTSAGLLLRDRAREIIDLVEKTESDMRGSEEAITGTIHFGAAETDGVSVLMQTASELQKDYPGINYNFFSGDGHTVLDHLDKGLVDFGVMFGDYDHDRYNVLELPYEDTWCVLMRADDKLAKKEVVTSDDLRALPLILSRQSTESGLMQRWFECGLEDLNVFCVYNLILNATRLVRDGLGYALALDNLVPVNGQSGLTSRPVTPMIRDRLKLIWKKHQSLTHASELFLTTLQNSISGSVDTPSEHQL